MEETVRCVITCHPSHVCLPNLCLRLYPKTTIPIYPLMFFCVGLFTSLY
jgi:hypothetical protein